MVMVPKHQQVDPPSFFYVKPSSDNGDDDDEDDKDDDRQDKLGKSGQMLKDLTRSLVKL